MSIDIDRFEERSADELEELSNPELVLRFLYEHRDRAWKAKEIARRTPVTANSIPPVLSRLEDRGLVRHKGHYWAITNNLDRLRAAYDLHRVSQRFDELYGEEQQEDWTDTKEDH